MLSFKLADRRAQSAMYDALIFFILILLSSGVLFMGVKHLSDQKDVVNKSYRLTYTRQVQDSALITIVNDTGYIDENGDDRRYPQRNVLELIEMYLFLNNVEEAKHVTMDLTELDRSIQMVYKLSVSIPFRYGVKAYYQDGRPGSYEFSWNGGTIPTVAYGAQRTGLVNDSRIETTLYIWES